MQSSPSVPIASNISHYHFNRRAFFASPPPSFSPRKILAPPALPQCRAQPTKGYASSNVPWNTTRPPLSSPGPRKTTFSSGTLYSTDYPQTLPMLGASITECW
eukprot:GHVT01059762.1.p2 GENE.GHVT01059762.1~~GHVT01059762.1.p2  ORF type:complete len:103 (-),score=15.81 GHVT01059762.1:591-899(-)